MSYKNDPYTNVDIRRLEALGKAAASIRRTGEVTLTSESTALSLVGEIHGAKIKNNGDGTYKVYIE